MILLLAALGALAQDETLVDFSGEDNGIPVPLRIHLVDPAGKPVKVKDRVAWNDHWIALSRDYVSVPGGTCRAAIERGPEFEAYDGPLIFRPGTKGGFQFNFKRLANLAAEGWWSGDLHVH